MTKRAIQEAENVGEEIGQDIGLEAAGPAEVLDEATTKPRNFKARVSRTAHRATQLYRRNRMTLIGGAALASAAVIYVLYRPRKKKSFWSAFR